MPEVPTQIQNIIMILRVSKMTVNKAWIQSKIHAEPASQTSFANQWCRKPASWHGVWRHHETYSTYIMFLIVTFEEL